VPILIYKKRAAVDLGMSFAEIRRQSPTGSATMRQFQSASGRTWSVDVSPLDRPAPDVEVPPKVLRFSSPGLTCELREWPENWEQIPQPQLMQLLDKALTEWVSSSRT
jgi:hypothetical protein